jgi:predicted dehydrogenase/threonine dehydrogenase-like Zn-dependent dehydrogenase
MKQIIQNARTGALEIADVPTPIPEAGQVLVRNHFSVVSAGTEALSLAFARKSMLGKARSRPDLTKQVIRKLRDEGPVSTYRTVINRLDSPQPLGYSCAGVVEGAGHGVSRFAPGDRVACAGAGYANHAEFVVVPENLAAHVPDGVSMDHAAFATLGAIALQGVRQAAPTLGEVGAVVGLGLIGQVAVQLLRANGCRVVGIDLDPRRVKQALEQGAEWGGRPDDIGTGWADEVTDGHGADFVLVTASAETSAPLQLAAEISRHRGRIVVVGAMPMELDRRSFYEKELQLLMSMSYGPGRYDRTYEEHGLDYPLPYVRWTENRNLQAFLGLLQQGALDLELLGPNVRPFSEALNAYEALSRGETEGIAALFRYDVRAQKQPTLEMDGRARTRPDTVGVGFIGAGNYAKSVLLPALEGAGKHRRVALATATGASARRTAERYGFASCGTDPDALIGDGDVDLVFVTTPHNTHADLATRVLAQDKAVWLEKPAALTPDELESLVAVATNKFLMVGFNRRFSVHARTIESAFAKRSGPLSIRYTIAAGAPAKGSWALDPAVGGGRVIGEICHFVDLCQFLVGQAPEAVYARALSRNQDVDDSVVTTIGYADGSTAVIEYLAHANPELPKERFEVSAGGVTAHCENFRETRINGHRDLKTFNQDKGQATALKETLEAIHQGGPSPISLGEIEATSRITFAILESIRSGNQVNL